MPPFINRFVFLAFVSGVGLISAYGIYFLDCSLGSCPDGYFLPHNLPDHQVFMSVIASIDDIGVASTLIDNHGVAIFYGLLMETFGASDDSGAVVLTLIVNLMAYSVVCFLFFRLCDSLVISPRYSVSFALFPGFIFFGLLINKDILVVLLVIGLISSYMARRYCLYLVLGILLGLIRVQYIFLPLAAIFLSRGNIPRRVFLVYVLSALGAAIIAGNTSIFEIAEANEGFSQSIYQFNKDYWVASLVTNPIRVIHYLVAPSFGWLMLEFEGQLNLMKLIEALSGIFIFYLLPGTFRFLLAVWRSEGTRADNFIFGTIIGYFSILLLTPITEPRYLMPIVPLFMLATGIVDKNASGTRGRACAA